MRYLLFFLFLFCFTLKAYPLDSLRFYKQELEKLEVWSEANQFDKVIQSTPQLLKLLKVDAPAKLVLQIQFLNLLGDAYLENGSYDPALSNFEQAYQLLEEKQRSETVEMAEVLNKLGRFYEETKAFNQSLDYHERALDLRIKLLGPRSLKVADSYNNIGIIKYELGDFGKAKALQELALSIRSALLKAPHPLLAQSYFNLGLCEQSMQEYTLAEIAYQKAEAYYSASPNKYQLDLADVYLNMGTLYGDQERFEEYLSFQNRALAIYLKYLPPEHPDIALCYSNLANIYTNLGDFKKADQLNEKALSIRKKFYGAIHPDVGLNLYNMGTSLFMRGEELAAIKLLEEGAQALNYQADLANNFEQVNSQYTLLNLFFVSALSNWYYGIRVSNTSYFEQALEFFIKADHLIDAMRKSYDDFGSKLELAEQARAIYSEGIALCFELYQIENKKEHLEIAFQFSEKNKGLVLLESLQKTKAEQFAGIPDTILTQINILEEELTDLDKKYFLALRNAKKQDEQLLDNLKTLLFEKRANFSSILKEVEDAYPAYYKLRYQTKILSIEEIQSQLLKEKQSLVEYFVTDNQLFIFVINKEEFNGIKIELQQSLSIDVQNFHRAIQNFPKVSSKALPDNIERYIKAAHNLYQLLIEPIKSYLKPSLLIIPDGELIQLPFSALLKELPSQNQKFKTHPYLLKDYAITYNYSVNLMQEMMSPSEGKKLKKYLGVAPSFQTDNPFQLSPLKYNIEEVNEIQGIYKGDAQLEGEASKHNFLAKQREYKILHLATHGKANISEGEFSYLAFSASETPPSDNMLLYVREIYNLKTNAEIVILSACETGLGEMHISEGLSSIARSFSYAGAKSLVATQWSVDDQATKELIARFLKNIKKGAPKDLSIHQAKLDFLATSNQNTAHPYYWAPLVAVGNVEALDMQNKMDYWILGVMIPLMILGFVVWLFRKKKRSKLNANSNAN